MKKRILSFLLVTAMLIALIPLSASGEVSTAGADAEWLGDYESTSEYEIADVADFLAFTDAIANGKTFAGKVVKFTADVDLGARNVDPSKPGGQTGDGVNEGTDFAFKAANSKKIFSGVIDGQGHTLQGVNVSFGTGDYVGIFGGYLTAAAAGNPAYDGASAGVVNLTVRNTFVRGKEYVGGLFGRVETGTESVLLRNLTLDVSVYGTNYVGEIVGGCRSTNAVIENSVVSGSVSAAGSCIGGLIGWDLSVEMLIQNVICSSEITTTGTNVGGLIGKIQAQDASHTNSTTIFNTVFSGSVTSSTESSSAAIGGLVGCAGATGGSPATARSANLTIRNSTFFGSVHATSTTTLNKIGGLVGTHFDKSASSVTVRDSVIGGSITAGVAPTNWGTAVGATPTGCSSTVSNSLAAVTVTFAGVSKTNQWLGAGSGTKTDTENHTVDATALSPANLQSTLNENGFADKFTMDETGKVLPLGLLGMKKDAINAAHAPKVSDVGFEAKILGYQITAPADGRFNLQVRGGVKEEGLAEYSAIGLELVAIDRSGKVLTNVKNGSVKEITTVYSSILVNGESTSAEALHTGYVFGARISNISTNIGNVTILARIYYVQNGAKNYSDIAVITVDTGNVG